MQKNDYIGSSYAHGYQRDGIGLFGVTNCTVNGLTIQDVGGNGIYVDTSTDPNSYSLGVTIKNVTINNDNCNGIAVISAKDLVIDGCRITNPLGGAAPQDGIDFEPNYAGEQITNFTVRNTLLINNGVGGSTAGGSGIYFWAGNVENSDGTSPFTGTIENVTSYGNNQYGIDSHEYMAGLTVKDCLLVSNKAAGFRVDTTYNSQRDTITYSGFYGNTSGSSNGYTTRGTGCITTTNPKFYTTDISSPYCMYLDPSCSTLITKGASDGGYMGAFPVYVPEPGSFALLVFALLGIGAYDWGKRRRFGISDS